MDRDAKKRFIAARVAKELSDGDVVNLGIGLPTLIPDFLPNDINVILQSENGIVGTGPKPQPEQADPLYVTDAGGQPISINSGGAFIDSATSFGLIRGGHVDVTVLGALEVDEKGNLANWIIPGKMVPGMGGAMDLVTGAKKVIIAMEHTAKGNPKILKQCSLPYTAVNCVNMIVTEMGVIEVTPEGLVLSEISPDFTPEQVEQATEATLRVSKNLVIMK